RDCLTPSGRVCRNQACVRRLSLEKSGTSTHSSTCKRLFNKLRAHTWLTFSSQTVPHAPSLFSDRLLRSSPPSSTSSSASSGTSPVTPATAPSWRNPLPLSAPPSPLVNPKPRQPCPAFTKTATVTFSLPDSRSPPTPTHSCPTRATSTPCSSSPTPS